MILIRKSTYLLNFECAVENQDTGQKWKLKKADETRASGKSDF